MPDAFFQMTNAEPQMRNAFVQMTDASSTYAMPVSQ